MDKITVLMPLYNGEKFVAEAIESILSQTYINFEFIIIDDHSNDNSVGIVKSYNDPRICFYANERNLGISATLNRGINLASTNFIARMDADDISYPQRLERQFNYLSCNPDCALVSSLVRVISEDGKFLRQDNFKSEFFYYNLTFICWIYHSSVMYRTNIVKSVGMYTVEYSEDFELFWQISRNFKFYNIPEVHLDYRVTSQSLHQVLKKEEYIQAQRKQVLRNLRFYAGEQYSLPNTYIDCLQHDFIPFLEKQNISEIYDCLKELDFITQKILEKENVNRNLGNDQEASYFKKKFIISFFIERLSPLKCISLLIKLKHYKHALKYIKNIPFK